MVTQYEVRKVVRFWAGEIPSGIMVMYMIHVLLTPGQDIVDDLADALTHLYMDT